MELKEFNLDVPGKGKINVQFHLHFDREPIYVGEIHIHPDFESGMPHRAQLKKDDGQWKLYIEHPENKNGEIVIVPEFLDDDLSMEIANTIMGIRNKAAL